MFGKEFQKLRETQTPKKSKEFVTQYRILMQLNSTFIQLLKLPALNVVMPSSQHSLPQVLDFSLHKHPPTSRIVMQQIEGA